MGKVILLIIVVMLCGCSTPQSNFYNQVNTHFGEGFHALQFPVNRKFIGTEWIVKQGRPNETKGPGIQKLSEDRTGNIFSSSSNELFASLQTLYQFGPGAGIKARFEKTFYNNGVTYIRAANPGDIPFEKGIWYVSEALAVDNFLSSSGSDNKFEIYTKLPNDNLANAGVGFNSDARSGISGDKLILAYRVERRDESTYESSEKVVKSLSLNNKQQSFPLAELDATLYHYNSIEFERFSEELTWSCEEASVLASSEKQPIKSIWVLKLKDDKERLIAFPASINRDIYLKDCNRFSSVIRSYINSLTNKIERVKAQIQLKESSIDTESGMPLSALFDVAILKESFELERMK